MVIIPSSRCDYASRLLAAKILLISGKIISETEMINVNVYIARQPILNTEGMLTAYELLYREDETNAFASSLTGTEATVSLVSDAVTVFGLSQLTNGKPAFINFTQNLLMNDFALLLKPEEIVVEILEDTPVDELLIQKVIQLKEAGYTIAIDDYTGEPQWDALIPYVDIIKVDFMLLHDDIKRSALTKRFKHTHIKLLAEKVETVDEYYRAVDMGYSMFQGYFFSKPKMMLKKTSQSSNITFTRIMKELNNKQVDFGKISRAVEQDVGLTYKLLRRINSVQYHRGFEVTSVHVAIVRLGYEEMRRWILLVAAKSIADKKADELVKSAFLRAVFAEKIAKETPILAKKSGEAFILGMFSLLDIILEEPMQMVLEDLPLDDEVREALLGGENDMRKLLDFVLMYESGAWDGQNDNFYPVKLDPDKAFSYYLECVLYSDNMFKDSMN
ncbi:MAG: HDOD domain-containing protein [Oscillospiraceae bacterium]